MKIAYLGPKGSFTDLSVHKAFPLEHTIPYVTIPDCLEAVEDGEVDLAVVPLENALEGTVPLTVDYLFHHVDLKIVAELTTPIEQHLLVHPNHKDDYLKSNKIFSHPHALAQCHDYLRNHFKGISLEQMSSTSAAAQFIGEHPEENFLAIGNELAAEQYGLLTVVKEIHDLDINHTKFIVLAKSIPNNMAIPSVSRGEKTTIFVTLPLDRAGALHQVLSAFAWRKINLTKIESRPLKTELGQYFFTIDIDQKWDDILLPNAVKELETLGCEVKKVGTYQTYRFKTLPPFTK